MMAAEPTFSDYIDSRNRGEAEPKKKLKKRRSIRVSRVPSLKPSSRRSQSRFNWPPTDLSSDGSSLQNHSQIALSDSSPNYLKPNGSSYTKKEDSQRGSECDVNSVVSSSCGSSDRAVQPFIVMSDDGGMPQHPSSKEVSDAAPSYLKETRSSEGRKAHMEASPSDSDSSYDSSDQSKSSHSSQSNSSYSGQKPLQTTSRESSVRNVRILINKTSFKSKRPSLKPTQISEERNVDRATCSSIIKDSRFPEHVELEPGVTETDRISFVKVCRYHHCSLNGHCHDMPPPEKRFPYLRRKSGKPLMNIKASSVSKRRRKPSAGIVPKGSRYPEKGEWETLNQIRSSFAEEEDIPETTFELKEKHFGCYSMKSDVDESTSLAFGVELEGREIAASSMDDVESNITISGGNSVVPHTLSSELVKTLNNPAGTSCKNDANFNKKPSECIPSNMVRNLSSDFAEATKDNCVISAASDSQTSRGVSVNTEETNNNLKPDMVLVTVFTPAGDTEPKVPNAIRISEPAPPLEVQKPQMNKGKNISMWHLIHKHMAPDLVGIDAAKPLQGADGIKQLKKTDAGTAKECSDVSPQSPISNVGIDNHEIADEETEIRKLFAIKLVREAIEKILLPELQDQSSENQSITSDIVEDQELSEKNDQGVGPAEGCHSGSSNVRVGNIAADPKVLAHTDESIGEEEKKSETKSGKKFDKKSPNNWSNLKKWILLQRFVKELEKVRKFNPNKSQHKQLENDPEAEKVYLRHQAVDERKRSEEWMLDYALRQVVSELAPTQKRKVALLVKAFETVVPPQEEFNFQVTIPKLKDKHDEDAYITNKVDLSATEMEGTKSQAVENVAFQRDDWERSSVCEEHSETNGLHRPVVDGIQSSTAPCLKSDTVMNSCEEVPVNEESQREISIQNVSSLGTENLFCDSRSTSQSSTFYIGVEATATQDVLSAADEITLENIKTSEEEENGRRKSQPEQINLQDIKKDTDLRLISKLSSGNMVLNSKSIELHDVDEKSDEPLDKQNYMRMWHTVYQHVASSIATKVGSQLLGGEDEEVEDDKKSSEIDTFGPRVEPLERNHNGGKENREANHQQIELSRSEAVKLVQEAVDEILLPEILDDTSDTQSVTGEIIPDQDLSEKEHSDIGEQSILSSTHLNENVREFDRSEGGFSLQEEEKGSKHDTFSTKDSKQEKSPDKKKSDAPKLKNWSRLKKLMVLKRSIKAMEKARKLESQPKQPLPLPSDPEPEKIDLRHQMMDERRKAEQWMLDYAVQHIVTKLTPARKRRVAMLVEAFEAVVPLPQI